MSLPTEQHFILKEGKLQWIPEMPKKPKKIECVSDTACLCAKYAMRDGANRDVVDAYDDNCPHRYEKALQSAIDSAVEVSNQKEVIDAVFKSDILPKDEHGRKEWKIGAVYSLLCSVEKKEKKRYRKEGVWSKWYDTEPLWVYKNLKESKTFAIVTFT